MDTCFAYKYSLRSELAMFYHFQVAYENIFKENPEKAN
jgi:hypothetical protein